MQGFEFSTLHNLNILIKRFKKIDRNFRLKDKINVLRLKLILVPEKGVNNIRNI